MASASRRHMRTPLRRPFRRESRDRRPSVDSSRRESAATPQSPGRRADPDQIGEGEAGPSSESRQPRLPAPKSGSVPRFRSRLARRLTLIVRQT